MPFVLVPGWFQSWR